MAKITACTTLIADDGRVKIEFETPDGAIAGRLCLNRLAAADIAKLILSLLAPGDDGGNVLPFRRAA